MEAFRDCEQLKEVELCDGLEQIGMGAFADCHRLAKVEICDGPTKIERKVFYNCESLQSIKLPSTVKMICERAFYGCNQLTSVDLCRGIEKIDNKAFNFLSLRNLAIARVCFGKYYDLLRIFGSQQIIHDVLKSRFDGLPIHRLCYYQSNSPLR